MSPNMKSEMVRPGESSGAVGTAEWFLSCVFPQVSRQLVRPEKGPAAALEMTDEGSLPCMDSLVSLQVGALLVSLITVREVTQVTLTLSLSPPTMHCSGIVDWGLALAQH